MGVGVIFGAGVGDRWSADLARKCEDYSLNSFKSKYRIYCGGEHRPESKLAWLSVMQHYGVPTRLIDFTTSPYVALYFALETYNPRLGRDFSIFYLNYTDLMDRSIDYIRGRDRLFREDRFSIFEKQDSIFEEVIDRYSYDIAWVSEPIEANLRIDRQMGTFLISGGLNKKVRDILSENVYSGVDAVKITVPSSVYEGATVALRKMGINSKTIYGDLGGLAKSIKMDLSARV
ncbi:FRG domain-containing protein [Burkholderia contaminans]|uniref:FRG domain-containing protein n=1 Tax=Burkholderia contaminans TaxID=488447 RepID=UPI001CC1C5DE|nr:FRG domain-containing protein [Burkholderia contaminans]